MASLEADAPSGGGGEGVVTELNYWVARGGQKYPGNEAFAALVKAHTLTKIDLS